MNYDELVVKDTEQNIQKVCTVLCERKSVSKDEIEYYAQIAGFPNYKRFKLRHNEPEFHDEIARVLFPDYKKGKYTRSQIIGALDFFLNSFGRVRYEVQQSLSVSQLGQIMKSMLTKTGEYQTDGKPDTEPST